MINDAKLSSYVPFTDQHDELRESIRRFVRTELVPRADEFERDRWFPNDVFERLGELGLLGLKFATQYGGQGGGYLDQAVMTEEMQHCGSAGLAASIGTHTEIAMAPVYRFGTEDQKRRYLVGGIAGRKIGALGITEPNGGSDVASLRTRATRVDGGWVVNGEKTYITNGVRADFVVTAVRSTDAPRHRGVSLMIVDRQPGMQSTKLGKLGWHASDTATIAFDDVFVPEENLIGEEGNGFRLIMANFQWERIVMSHVAIGAMTAAWELLLPWVRERRTFGKALADHQAIRHRLADLAATLHTSRCLTYDALRRFVDGEDATREVSIAKLVTQRAAVDFTDECVQIFGGAGYMRETQIERMYRDARLGPIGGGTEEIMREIIGKRLLD